MTDVQSDVCKILDPAFLGESLVRLTSQRSFAERLAFGIRIGGCWERPLQYEWAFVLDNLIQNVSNRLRVVCEQDRVDIGFRCLPPSPDKRLEAGIELKVWGSWWVSKAEVENFKADIEKVRKTTSPSAAVAICIFASSAKEPLAWIDSEKQWNVKDGAGLQERLGKYETPELTVLTAPVLTIPHELFGRLELWAGAYFNAAAQPLTD